MKLTTIGLRFILLLPFVMAGNSIATSNSSVTSAQINGTWVATWKNMDGTLRTRSEMKISALGKHQLKVQFYGEYSYIDPSGQPAMNVGVSIGNATIKRNVIQFLPNNAAEEWNCEIAMSLEKGVLVVTQRNECGFGLHVHANGKYRRKSADTPTFDEIFWNQQ